ncbi:MAG: DUF4262 domain-containing protein, partial [Actinomycetota bacterium]|nr:DUF4262 domain-containing protein [Actinomycetota bacterium]
MWPVSNDRARPWRVVHVEHPRIGVPMSLTSGLWRLRGHPDLVVLDMPAPSARRYLDLLGERVHSGGALRAGALVDGLHEAFRFGLVAVEEDLRVELARWDAARRRDPRRPLLQLVWPDLCGTLPWEAGYAPAAAGLRQPLLGRWPRRGAR